MNPSTKDQLIKLGSTNPELRQHIRAILSYDRGLPDGLEGFDDEPNQRSPDQQSRYEIELLLRGYADSLNAARFLQPAGLQLLADPTLSFWYRQAWSVQVKAKDETTAKRQGLALQRKLLPPSDLDSSTPEVHHLPLYVRFQGRWVKLPALKGV